MDRGLGAERSTRRASWRWTAWAWSGDELEYEVIDEPRGGLFGLGRTDARIRARVKPLSREKPPDRRRRRSDRTAAERLVPQAASEKFLEPWRRGTLPRRRPARNRG